MFKRLLGSKAERSELVRQEPVLAAPEPQVSNSSSLVSSSGWEQWEDFFNFLGTDAVTRESAMKLTAVFGCVSLLAGTIGTLPVRVAKKGSGSGTEVLKKHPTHFLVHIEPHEMFSPEVFFEGLSALAFLDGNSYAEILRDGRGQVIGLRPLFEAYVKPFKRGKRIAYRITEEGKTYGRDQDDILHFRGSATMNGLEALSPLKCFARSIGIGLDADEYAGRFFKQGINPPGYITYEGKVTEQMADEVRNYWQRKFGGVKNAHIPAVLSEGGNFKSLMTDPETAQLLESRSFQVLDVARAYGVPPHLIGETEKSTSWGTGINAQTTQFYILGLRKHVKRFEGELSRKLLTREERLDGTGFKFNLDTLLRADLAARYDAHKIAVGGTQHPGWMTPNEVREMEGLPRKDDPAADRLFTPASKTETGKKTEENPLFPPAPKTETGNTTEGNPS
ncbi:Phage portal protein [Pseudovibrio sp. Ad5]|uniref:phage portal protein n=1 Tax=Pseudovibrio sp. Ad5 TaxID=989436 RepID=UPI0007AE6F26|nr:phage portal protein [Pseudovibrio sp. Ad5]KZK96330.1 Phage portal protein [Pseudovibrio sp. Ad5]